MSYTPPTGLAVNLAFTGSSYTPPTGLAVNLDFVSGGGGGGGGGSSTPATLTNFMTLLAQ